MKLRNKKTGEIKAVNKGVALIHYSDGTTVGYNSLAELNEEWEDAPEEPKEYWFINSVGGIIRPTDTNDWTLEDAGHHKEIGNYFETREEAELAVHNLKAWKRLKDKGFRFEGWDNTDRSTIHNFSLFVAIEDLDNINRDLDLLFGGEE